MGLLDQIRAARQAHEELRSAPPTRATLPLKAERYQLIKTGLDEAWAAAGSAAATSAADICRAVQRLTVDAEYFAGLSDAEGFRNLTEAMAAYDLLERAFAGGVGGPDVR